MGEISQRTTSVCCDSLFSNDAKVNNINRIDFEKLLRATLHNALSILKEKLINRLTE